jgi:hypothetical protein
MVTLWSELMEASEGLGGALITVMGGLKLEDMERVRRGKDEDDFGDEDAERLGLSRSLECRPNGGLTNFEKKPGAIVSLLFGVSDHSYSHTRRSRLTQLEITVRP